MLDLDPGLRSLTPTIGLGPLLVCLPLELALVVAHVATWSLRPCREPASHVHQGTLRCSQATAGRPGRHSPLVRQEALQPFYSSDCTPAADPPASAPQVAAESHIDGLDEVPLCMAVC